MQLYADGIGGSLGDRLVTSKPLYMAGNVWYVHFTNGTDGASPAGKERLKPLKTIQQAVTNSADGDIIVLLSGSSEVIATPVNTSKRLTIAGEGLSGNVPQASIGCNQAAGSALVFTGAYVELRNIRFLANSQNNNQPIVDFNGASCRVSGCRFECDDHHTTASLRANLAVGLIIENSTFVNTAVTTPPAAALLSAGACNGMMLRDLVFDGGSIGFSGGIAADFSAAAIANFKAEGITLTRGADMAHNATSTGWIAAPTATLGGRVIW